MSEIGFEEFRKMVLCDESLQAELRDLHDRSELISRVVELGAERNFRFTAADVEDAFRQSRREWIER